MKSLPRMGILGGGQLARMLVQAAQKHELPVSVLVANDQEPAAQIADDRFYGAAGQELKNRMALNDFFADLDLVLFENEFVPCDVLAEVGVEFSLEFFPSLSVISVLQDKLGQKNLLKELGIPHAGFTVLSSPVTTGQLSALKNEKRDFILKWSKLGYDGYGNFELRSSAAPQEIEKALEFSDTGVKKGAQIFAEEKIQFQRELAIVSCRSKSGEIIHYPLTVTEQKSGACYLVKGPATAFGVSPATEKQARQWSEAVAEKIGLVGTYAIEFFETGSVLTVNEIAPRVHNSGHYTLDACDTSQFENHLFAAQGRGLNPPETAPFFSMLNLLAPQASSKALSPQARTPIVQHWYGKTAMTLRRKMGHLNAVAQSREELENKILVMKEIESAWIQEIKKNA
jgi:5-(carboxyamino)imidazole ribonucleotide synthase